MERVSVSTELEKVIKPNIELRYINQYDDGKVESVDILGFLMIFQPLEP